MSKERTYTRAEILAAGLKICDCGNIASCGRPICSECSDKWWDSAAGQRMAVRASNAAKMATIKPYSNGEK